jgi:hypothetical protein
VPDLDAEADAAELAAAARAIASGGVDVGASSAAGSAASGDEALASAEAEAEELDPILEESDVARTVWLLEVERDDGSKERLQVLLDGAGKAIWEGSVLPLPRTGTWSLRSDRLLFTRDFLLGAVGFKETYVAAPSVNATDDLKLRTGGIVRGWAYLSPALKIGEFVMTRKATNVGA